MNNNSCFFQGITIMRNRAHFYCLLGNFQDCEKDLNEVYGHLEKMHDGNENLNIFLIEKVL